ncbi:MAG: hypothetical protein ACJ70S_04200 [Nitrososphaera sp.]
MAVIIAIPALTVTFIMHYVIKAEFFLTLAAGLITLFIAMGFGYKLSKKFVKVLSRDNNRYLNPLDCSLNAMRTRRAII